MSSLEELDALEQERKEDKDDKKKEGGDKGDKDKKTDGDAEMKDAEPEKEEDILDEEILNSSTRDIVARRRLLENDMRIMKSEFQRLTHEKASMNEKIKDNLDKIENNRLVLTNPDVGLFVAARNMKLNNIKTITLPRWKRRRNPGSRCHC
jgi:26S proteasome regulatory subunit T5